MCQLINNQLVMSPAPTSQHQRVSRNIFRQLDKHVESNKLGEVFYAPVDVYLDEKNVYQPDILFISNERMEILQDKVKGAPDLIVEILSPKTGKLDKTNKKDVYEQAGVKEYWIVDPNSKEVIGYQLTESGYKEIPSQKGVIHSSLFGTTIRF